MGKCSTLIYSFDNLKETSSKFINLEEYFNEIDASLQLVLKGIELNVNPDLVKKTLALIKGIQ